MGFGFTLRTDATGDIVYNEDTKKLELVHDNDALKQDLLHRFQTEEGQDLSSAVVGLPLLTFTQDQFDRRVVAAAVREEALRDPRIQNIQSLRVGDVDQNTRKVQIDLKLLAVDGSTFTVSTLAQVV